MILEKSLTRIHEQIEGLAPALELFLDESVQPTLEDCEDLQRKLVHLQETLAVYAYHRREKELSPNFNLHAKVSEMEQVTEERNEIRPENDPELLTENKTVSAEAKILAAISIGINDKFRIINELFRQNAGEYNIAIEQLNCLQSWNEAELYLHSLKLLYNWSEQSDVTQLLYQLAKKRYL